MKKYLLSFLLIFWFLVPGHTQIVTSEGTDFWIAFPPNASYGAILSIFISSNFSTSGTVSSAFPGVNQSFTVVPNVVTQLSLPSLVALSGGIENKGIEITSADPVSVYGLNRQPATTDAYLALPVTALGMDYRVVTYKSTITGFGSCFSIVGTQDGTAVTIFNQQNLTTTNINLDKGQTYHYESPLLGDDLTGSRIQSSLPVAVFGSVDCVDIPGTTCQACDHIVEEMFPYYSWGKNFLTFPLAGRDNSGDVFRIVAAEDGTDITINGASVATINAGQFYETVLVGSSSITTSKATILAQFAKGMYCSGSVTGDPFMMLLPPREQFLTHYTIVTLTGFTTHWVNIVAPDYALGTIYQDGVLIPNGAFTQIGTTNYYGAQISVTVGSHTFNSTVPFGVFVYGWTIVDSYGYPGGGSLSPVGTVNSVTLSPDTAYGQLNVTNVCLTAYVSDNLSSPVPGVLVNFYVSGINPLTGNAYTDATGNAVYCYTQTGAAPGTDHVYAEVFGYMSDTSTVIWSYTPPCINPTNGGTIGNDQTGCGSFTPSALTSLVLPTGQSGTLEFKWQLSTTSSSSGFSDIAGSNTASYSPGILSQTTWYKRIARVDCMTDWTGSVESNVVEITVNTPLLVTITVTPSANPVCAGSNVTFTANPTHEGLSPVYQWYVNGVGVGANLSTYSYIPLNGDIVSCTLTSSEPCTSGNPASSIPVQMVVNTVFPVSVTVNTTQNPVCSGTTVTFTAYPSNEGANSSYQWKVNGVGVGANLSTYSYIPLDGDVITCTLTSSEPCTTGNPASSNQYQMTVNPNLPVGVSVLALPNPFCQGSPVTFTATPEHGGLTPSYQWKVNGNNTGGNSQNFIYNPANNDQVSCVLTSSEECTTGNPASSINIQMVEIAQLPAGITISPSANPFCPGSSVTFTTYPSNEGSNPSYQWKVNGINAGTNSVTFTYNPVNNDSVRCIMTSNLNCVTGSPVSSASIVMSGTLGSSVTFISCFDTITAINAKPIKLKGGIPLGGIYSGPGVNSLTGVFSPAIAGVGTQTITYAYTNAALCTTLAHAHIINHPLSFFSCGDPITDIRDNKIYQTVHIGTQCWLASNLNYGTMLASSQDQRDNCLNEKYCYNDNPVNCTNHGGLYQWDEVMLFDETNANQGFCPPGWHIPAENEWNTLFGNFINSGFAGSPLKYTGYSGFNALMSGARHINKGWDFQGFATFFWSSSSYNSNKAWAHGMNDLDPSVSHYPSSRVNAFSVRCLKD